MQLFYSQDISDGIISLDKDESLHCIKVLRHKVGDEISIIDGRGTLYKCKLIASDPKKAQAAIVEEIKGFGGHPYRLTMAVCPTKNIERYEWFIEKSTEMGIDCIVPVIGQYSERKDIKSERLNRILLSAVKQSLKSSLPELYPSTSLIDFLKNEQLTKDCLKLICCCFEPEGGRKTITEMLKTAEKGADVAILIGPEGDFSNEELNLALRLGWTPISLGSSRLRTETAAVCATSAVYLYNLDSTTGL